MLYINKITNNASQQLTLTGITGITINMMLEFFPRINQWVMGITYLDQSIQGISLVAAPNLLRQWKNVLPFGISCICPDGLDPYQVTDFANQRALLFLLNAADVEQVETDWFTADT